MKPPPHLDAPRARLWTCPFVATRAQLTASERALLDAAPFSEPRRREWIRGRVAARALLPAGASVLCEDDGAPRVADAPGYHISLSHDSGALAVAVRREGPIAVDLAARADAARLAAVLVRLRPAGCAAEDPVRAWVALECALKLRRLGISSVLGLAIGFRRLGAAVLVTGVGATVLVRFPDMSRDAAAWCVGLAW